MAVESGGSVQAAQPETEQQNTQAQGVLKVHYHRWGGDYERPTLWTWDSQHRRSPEQPEIAAAGEDDFGVFFLLDPAQYGLEEPENKCIGMIPRLNHSWDHKDGDDRYWRAGDGLEIWLIEGEEHVFTSPPDIGPRVTKAFLDGWTKVRVCLSHPIPVGDLDPKKFKLVRNAGVHLPVQRVEAREVVRGKARSVELKLAKRVRSINEWIEVGLEGYRSASVIPGELQFDPKTFVTDERLGAIWTPNATTFRIFSPPAVAMSIVLYQNAIGPEGRREIPMSPRANGTWEVVVEEPLEGWHYTLMVRTNHDDSAMEFQDPHAVNTTGTDGRARITNLRATDPAGFRPVKRPFSGVPTDAVIYEISVRDFTIAENSTHQAKGKYVGFADKGTRLLSDQKIRTGIDHLMELGVTHVQLLPIQDFDNDESNPQYNWGYMTAFFNSPEGWYATDIRGDARVREFKRLVQALHDAGIAVILDVVYNHTGVLNTFEKVAPGYYHRLYPDGKFWNGSGCGNEFKSESPMGRKFIVDSCKYWVEEYGIDGFRFDLMGLVDVQTMKEVHREVLALVPNGLVYGEPWAAAQTGLGHVTDKHAVAGTGVGAFNDNFRNALKGEPDGSSPGYVQNGFGRYEVKRGIAGSIDDWATDPVDTINYATCHDNLTLWDKLEVSCRASEVDRMKMQMLTIGVLAVSQGILFLHGGMEVLRTKFGCHNSYDKGDKINQFDWELKKKNAKVFDYVRELIALRRAHPMFRLSKNSDVRKRLHFEENHLPVPSAIAFTLDGMNLEGETWKRAAVLINPEGVPVEFPLPDRAKFGVYALGSHASLKAFDEAHGSLIVPPRSMAIVAQ